MNGSHLICCQFCCNKLLPVGAIPLHLMVLVPQQRAKPRTSGRSQVRSEDKTRRDAGTTSGMVTGHHVTRMQTLPIASASNLYSEKTEKCEKEGRCNGKSTAGTRAMDGVKRCARLTQRMMLCPTHCSASLEPYGCQWASRRGSHYGHWCYGWSFAKCWQVGVIVMILPTTSERGGFRSWPGFIQSSCSGFGCQGPKA
jgi:hypothetical protein